MIEVAVGLGLDQRGAASATGALDGFECDGANGECVHSIDDDTRHAVRGSALGNVGELHVTLLRRELGVAVVLAHEQHGQVPHGSHVRGFMEGTDVGRSVAEEARGNSPITAVLRRECGTYRDRNAATDDRVGAEHAAIHVDDVHAAAATLAVAGRLAIELGEHRAEFRALGDRVAMAAVGRRDLVGIAEDRHHAGGNSLLPDIEVKESGHVTGLDQLARGLLEQTDPHHAPVQVQDQIPAGIVGISLAGTGRDCGVTHGAPDENEGRRT